MLSGRRVRCRASAPGSAGKCGRAQQSATQFIATSIYIKRVLDQWKPSGKRGLRKVICCFFGALLGGVIAPLSRIQASREPTFLAPSAKHARAVVGTPENPLSGKER
jgi:hypothetical protein